MYGRIKKIHFVGIGGIGMSGIAEVMINMGYTVTGSDLRSSKVIERLIDLGADISIGHKAKNAREKDVVVYSSIITDKNPEIIEAHKLGTPVIPRAEMLAELMRLKYGIAVAGSHGKTTTTSLISSVLDFGGFDPTVVVGGRIQSLGTNAYFGKGDFMVVEADESDGSFLKLSPVIAVITNIDDEHMDHYKDSQQLDQAFSDFVNKIPFYGLTVVCADNKRAMGLLGSYSKRYVTYGLAKGSDYQARDIQFNYLETVYRLYRNNKLEGQVKIQLPGIHNALNSLVAFAIGFELGIAFDDIVKGLEKFSGIERRIQVKGIVNGITVVDDYGHHPKEIDVTLKAVLNAFSPRKLKVIFQPHRYSRTKNLFAEFVQVFKDVSPLYLADVYAAGEEEIEEINSGSLAQAIKKAGNRDVNHFSDTDKLIDKVISSAKPGDVVITLGAGNIWAVGEKIVQELKK
ncbi:MAG: UDP-N-acetylmuramate--L-alanine ligase [Candidatus Dadabacteria bacterium]|nr:UDP-N-acetylmuramate--L-alanine ligase [Candidatus Dadabacteria bacterium]NIS10273.1 UDP-N-acetylmuramate--L-alanine ligase [Candidatus Dadabacteria bacterium]NIY23199.1 UDP-N-acetylmuramate--L-alanine ligase [Candidatus Dadabacteria bacterium]